MAADTTVSFKVYLADNTSSTPRTEVRRFGIDRYVVSNFSYLQQKLEIVFPCLRGKAFYVSWTDADGDAVVISSDEELLIALTELPDVKKLNVVAGSKGLANLDTSKHQHPGVECDGCNGSVIGFRYKCLSCRNFDLCESCEMQHVHPQHTMIRIPSSSFPKNFVMGLEGLFDRELISFCHKKHNYRKRKGKCDKYDSETGEDSNDNDHGDNRHCAKKWKRRHNHHHKYWNYDFLPLNLGYSAGAEARNFTEDGDGDALNMKYFKTLCKTFASFLDPSGVDIEIRPKDCGDEKKSPNTSEKAPESSNGQTENQKDAHSNGVNIDFVDKIQEITDFFANHRVSETPEKDDWTIVNQTKDNKPAESTGAIPKTQTSQTENTTPQTSQTENTTPQTSSQQPTPSVPIPPTNIPSAGIAELYPNLRELNPLHAQALDQLLSMGFTNDGGLLYRLLENKNGDIYRVLDALHPPRK